MNCHLKDDLTGRRFGRLVVVRFDRTERGRSSFWFCRCDCGTEKVVNRNQLLHKDEPTRSCGCLQKEKARANKKHGMWNDGIYDIWTAMKQRCSNRNHPSYPDYGGRGIRVCSRWKDFSNFLKDMGHPSNLGIGGVYLERKNNNKGYRKSNCIWATIGEQLLNRRNTIYLEHAGERKPLLSWCREKGFRYGTALARFHLGKSFEQIFKPYKKRTRGVRSI